ncbi:hypothetical protein V7x_43100 [Crateriforma conspicua]|uniref:Uncharacterized protein n=2 Tax=Crateriforma conspicua TaxID=2527996 RepID=A0A5C6FJW7_9PLAN|nr:hypothetical protein V7x_43100 [Crateriforma conspicua]
MVKRILLSGVAGAVVYFVWQMLTWMVIQLHGPTVSKLPDETAIRDELVSQNIESGVYVVPFGNDDEDMMDPDSEFMKRHKAGPIFAIYYHKEGLEPMSMSVLGIGLLTDFFGAAIAASMLCCALGGCCCRTYLQRVGFVTALGVFLALMGHVAYYNWMHSTFTTRLCSSSMSLSAGFSSVL